MSFVHQLKLTMSYSCRHSMNVVARSKDLHDQRVSPQSITFKQSGLIRHACACRNRKCMIPLCIQFRRVMCHFKVCCGATNRSSLCQEVYKFCAAHVRRCDVDDCVLVEFCRREQLPTAQQSPSPSSKRAKFIVI